jgi:hypothetical protein
MWKLKFQEKIFTYVIYIIYILYFLSIFRLSSQAPEYLKYLHLFITNYICLFLIIRFNPFIKTTFNSLDRRVAFSAGLFIFTTSFINETLIYYYDEIKNSI